MNVERKTLVVGVHRHAAAAAAVHDLVAAAAEVFDKLGLPESFVARPGELLLAHAQHLDVLVLLGRGPLEHETAAEQVSAVREGVVGAARVADGDEVDEAEAAVRAVHLLRQAHVLELTEDAEELLDLLGLGLERYVAHKELGRLDIGGIFARRRRPCRLSTRSGRRLIAHVHDAVGELELETVAVERVILELLDGLVGFAGALELDEAVAHGQVLLVGRYFARNARLAFSLFGKELLQRRLVRLEAQILDEERRIRLVRILVVILLFLLFFLVLVVVVLLLALSPLLLLGLLLLGLLALQLGLLLRIALEYVHGRPLQVDGHRLELAIGELLEGVARLLPLAELDKRGHAVLGHDQAPYAARAHLGLVEHVAQLGVARPARQVLDENGCLAALRGHGRERVELDAVAHEKLAHVVDYLRLADRQLDGHARLLLVGRRGGRVHVVELALVHLVAGGHEVGDGVLADEERVPVVRRLCLLLELGVALRLELVVLVRVARVCVCALRRTRLVAALLVLGRHDVEHAALEDGAVELVEGLECLERKHARDVGEALGPLAERVDGHRALHNRSVRLEQLLQLLLLARVAEIAQEEAAVLEVAFVLVFALVRFLLILLRLRLLLLVVAWCCIIILLVSLGLHLLVFLLLVFLLRLFRAAFFVLGIVAGCCCCCCCCCCCVGLLIVIDVQVDVVLPDVLLGLDRLVGGEKLLELLVLVELAADQLVQLLELLGLFLFFGLLFALGCGCRVLAAISRC